MCRLKHNDSCQRVRDERSRMKRVKRMGYRISLTASFLCRPYGLHYFHSKLLGYQANGLTSDKARSRRTKTAGPPLYHVTDRRGYAHAFSTWALARFIFPKRMLIQSCRGRIHCMLMKLEVMRAARVINSIANTNRSLKGRPFVLTTATSARLSLKQRLPDQGQPDSGANSPAFI